ncbi:MAG: T9SS type A sorting domain-containing protein, partial [Bacteroidota bacterium]
DGSLLLGRQILSLGSTFLLSDLENQQLLYSSFNGSPTFDYFSFTLNDGEGGQSDTIGVFLSDRVITSFESPFLIENMELFPIPFREKLHVKLHHTLIGRLEWRIINSQGLEVMEGENTKTTSNWEGVIDLSTLKPGLYFLEIRIGKARSTRKIIKQ